MNEPPIHDDASQPAASAGQWSFSLWALMKLVLGAAVAVAVGKPTAQEIADRIADSHNDYYIRAPLLWFDSSTGWQWGVLLIDDILGGIGMTLLAATATWVALSLADQALSIWTMRSGLALDWVAGLGHRGCLLPSATGHGELIR
jgi:hypothetical protein